MIATDVEERLSEAAKERMQAGGRVTTKQGVEEIPYPAEDKGKARDQAAEITGTNENDGLTSFFNYLTSLRYRI